MSFPLQFVEKKSDYDFISPIVNFTGNSLVVSVGGISLSVISYLGLKALGVNQTAATIVTAIPVTIGAIGSIGVAIGGFFGIAICATVGAILKPALKQLLPSMIDSIRTPSA